MSKDTRRDKRTPIALKVRFKSATVSEFIDHYSSDISKGGIFIKSKSPMPVGTLLKFEFQLRDNSPLIQGVGRVVWKRDDDNARPDLPPGMGIKFIKMDERSRQIVNRIVSGREQPDDDAVPQQETSTDKISTPMKPGGVPKPKVAVPRPKKPEATKIGVAAFAMTEAASKKDGPDSSQEGDQPEKAGEPVPDLKAEPEKAHKPAVPKPVIKEDAPAAEEKDEAVSEPGFDLPDEIVLPGESAGAEEDTAAAPEEPAAAPEETAAETEKAVEETEESEAETKEAEAQAAEKDKKEAAVEEKKAPEEKKKPEEKTDRDKAAAPAAPAAAAKPEKKSNAVVPVVIVIALLLGAGAVYFISQMKQPAADQAPVESATQQPAPEPAKPEKAPQPPPEQETAPQPSEPAEAPAEQAAGIITITTDPPGASVFVDNVEQEGVSPLEIAGLEPGAEVEIRAKLAGHIAFTRKIKPTEEAQEIKAALKPMPRKLIVTSEPDNSGVLIDDQWRGKTPITITKLPDGDVIPLKIQKSGYRDFSRDIGPDEFSESEDFLVAEVMVTLERSSSSSRRKSRRSRSRAEEAAEPSEAPEASAPEKPAVEKPEVAAPPPPEAKTPPPAAEDPWADEEPAKSEKPKKAAEPKKPAEPEKPAEKPKADIPDNPF